MFGAMSARYALGPGLGNTASGEPPRALVSVPAQGRRQGAEQEGVIERLPEERVEPLGRTSDEPRHGDHGDLASAPAERFQHLRAREAGHADVDEEDVGQELGHGRERGGPRGHRHDIVTFGGQQLAQQVQDTRLVIDHENSGLLGLHLSQDTSRGDYT
jgi:hypothetical protein